MEPVVDAPRPTLTPSADGGRLLPRWLRRCTIGLYVATAACVLVAVASTPRHGPDYPPWPDDGTLLLLVPYCLAYAVVLQRARRPRDPGSTDLRSYALAFGDGPLPDAPAREVGLREAWPLIPFLVHGVCGLWAGAEVAVFRSSMTFFGGVGSLAGALGLLVGWIPAIPLMNAKRSGGWLLLASALGLFVLYRIAATLPDP